MSSPVLAAEFWVSQDPTTKICKIEEKMPDGKTQVMVRATSYPTKKEGQSREEGCSGRRSLCQGQVIVADHQGRRLRPAALALPCTLSVRNLAPLRNPGPLTNL